jgi:hypothetical protein
MQITVIFVPSRRFAPIYAQYRFDVCLIAMNWLRTSGAKIVEPVILETSYARLVVEHESKDELLHLLDEASEQSILSHHGRAWDLIEVSYQKP